MLGLLLLFSFLAFSVTAGQSSNRIEVSYSPKEYAHELMKHKSEVCTYFSESTNEKMDPKYVKVYLHYGTKHECADMTNYTEHLKLPYYNFARETKILIHDWMQKVDVEMNDERSQLYAYRGKEVNVISLDWSKYSCNVEYDYVAQYIVPEIAKYLSDIVAYIRSSEPHPTMHLIGFGMGAHIAGIASKSLGDKKVERITALSPAGAIFESMPADKTLQRGDAKFMDGINTNQGYLGHSQYFGDVDFFPNGGRFQPLAEEYHEVASKIVSSHFAAVKYFWESVLLGHSGFIGKYSDSWDEFVNNKNALNESEIMGESVSYLAKGTVYLYVNHVPYYSRGIRGLYEYEHDQKFYIK